MEEHDLKNMNQASVGESEIKNRKTYWNLKSRKNEAKLSFKEWCLNSSIHGIPNIYRTRFFCIKIFWIILFFLSLASCLTLVILTIIDYAKYETAAKIERFYEYPAEFPSISLCNQTPFIQFLDEEFYTQFLSYVKDQKTLDYFRNFSLNSTNSSKVLDDYLKKIAYTLADPSIDDSFKRKLGLPSDLFIFKCEINNKPCDMNNILWYFDPKLGNCYTINLNRNQTDIKPETLSQNEPGVEKGLRLEIFSGVKPKLKNKSSTIEHKLNLSPKTGIHVSINSRNESFESKNTYHLSTEMGKCVWIRIEKIIEESIPMPYENCFNLKNFKSDLYEEMKRLKYMPLDQNKCFKICTQREIVRKCSCYDLEFPIAFYSNPTPPCLGLDQIDCKKSIRNEFNLSECLNECPFDCNTVKYQFEKSFISKFPNTGLPLRSLIQNEKLKAYFDEENLADELISSNFACFNFYFDQISLTKISDFQSRNAIDLLANIGGILSLFVGISILSIVEVIDLVADLIYISKIKR